MEKQQAWCIRVEAKAQDDLEIAIYDIIGESFFGDGVTAKDVLASLRSAPQAKNITLRINSIGGILDDARAMVNLLAQRQQAGATITAYVDGIAASAASYLTTVADRVVMPDNTFMMVHRSRAGMMGNADEMSVVADMLRKYDHQLAEAYAAASTRRGKKKTPAMYLTQFALGDLYLTADEAVSWGLADEITEGVKAAACLVDVSGLLSAPAALRGAPYVSQPEIAIPVNKNLVFPIATTATPEQPAPAIVDVEQITSAAVGGVTRGVAPQSNQGKKNMTLEEFKSQHPELYAAAVALGEAQGTKAERDRVGAHLTFGKQSGAMDVALAAIDAGEGMTMTLQAQYMTAGMNRAAVGVRQAESDAAGAVVDVAAVAAPVAPVRDLGDLVVAAMQASPLA